MGFLINPYLYAVAGAAKTLVDHAVDATDLTTYTFSSRSIGAAATDREIFLGINCGSSRTISSCSIDPGSGAIAGTLVKRQQQGSGTAELWRVSIPSATSTSTTGTVSVTCSGATNNCGIGIWRVTGLSSTTPLDTKGGNQGVSGSALSLTLTTQAGGILIAVARCGSSTDTTWTTITEDYDELVESPAIRQAGASMTTTGSSTTITVAATSVNTNSPVAAASFF